MKVIGGPEFLPGRRVHFIQASLAWQDTENWLVGRLISVEGRKLSVELSDNVVRMYWSDSAPVLVEVVPVGVFVNERYSVLAVESSRGNVVVNDKIVPPAGSIFDLSNGNLLFISIDKADDSET
jgi:hypothetical protein